MQPKKTSTAQYTVSATCLHRPSPPAREVFQPHYQRVTQIESFELDGVQLVVTASVDQCIVLCTITGEKVRARSGWVEFVGRS